MYELEMKIGGLDYSLEIDVDEDYVVGVNKVSVFDGKIYFPIDMNKKELADFYDFYEDYLNESWQDRKIALAECCAEENWERSNDR